jgi:hypothetical protein
MRIFIGGLTDGNITAADLQSRLQPYAAVEAIDLHSNFAHITLNPISDSHWKKCMLCIKIYFIVYCAHSSKPVQWNEMEGGCIEN